MALINMIPEEYYEALQASPGWDDWYFNEKNWYDRMSAAAWIYYYRGDTVYLHDESCDWSRDFLVLCWKISPMDFFDSTPSDLLH